MAIFKKKKEFLIDANTLLILAGCGSMRVSYVRGPMCVVIVSLGLCLASTGETEVYKDFESTYIGSIFLALEMQQLNLNTS